MDPPKKNRTITPEKKVVSEMLFMLIVADRIVSHTSDGRTFRIVTTTTTTKKTSDSYFHVSL